MYLYERLLLLLEYLNEDELDYKIAHYLVYHQKEAIHLSLRDLAKKVYVSPPTIVRFVERLGVADYKTFKSMLLNDLQLRTKPYKKRNDTDVILTVSQLAQQINPQAITHFVNQLREAKTILFHGKPIYWAVFRELVTELREDGKQVDNLTYKKEATKCEMLNKLTKDDMIMMMFPSRDIYDVSEAHQKVEFEFLSTLENLTCVKYFFGQVLSSYPRRYSVIEIPYCVNESMYQMLMIILKDRILELYRNGK